MKSNSPRHGDGVDPWLEYFDGDAEQWGGTAVNWDESRWDARPMRNGDRAHRDHPAGKRRRPSANPKGGWGSYPKS